VVRPATPSGEANFPDFNTSSQRRHDELIRHRGPDVGRNGPGPVTDADGPRRPRVCRRPPGQPIAAIGQPSTVSSFRRQQEV